MQAVTSSCGYFMDVNIGWPGKVHDARVLVNSSLYCKANRGQLVPNWKRTINGTDVPLLILGDPAYPLLPWLMKPYPENGATTPQQHHFNYRLSRARMVIENAFGRLKGRWRCLLKRMDYYELEHAINVIASCIVLHNLCELHGDPCDPQWIHHDSLPTSTTSTNDHHNYTSKNTRDTLKDYLYSNQ